MSMKWKLTDRTKMLLKLELAITLPAVALMGFSIWNLKHIQRDHVIEAALQRDLQSVLKIAEKKTWMKADDLVDPIRKDFPSPEEGTAKINAKLDRILAENPELAFVVFYDKPNHIFTGRMQSADSGNPAFCDSMGDKFNMFQGWFSLEGPSLVEHLRMMKQKEDQAITFEGDWSSNKGRREYWSYEIFVPPSASHDRVSIGVVGLDPSYVQNNFLPGVMKDVLSDKSNGPKPEANPPAIMVRPSKDSDAWLASANWDGPKPEVELASSVFPGMVWGMKNRGTTIADMAAKFLRYNYTVLGALSLLMIGGIFLTYRNVSREMNLARLKSDFVANVSHELRTPLALIRLYAETLELGRLNAKEKYQEYFRIIREESERLSALINNILDFSRIEAGRKEYDFKETDLSELIRSTLDSYRFQIEQNGFKFEENISPDIPPVNVDREAIARSLLNLVNNALKYSKDRKFIGVTLYRANGSVKLEVQDHGIGIPPSEQEKIFEKFYRCGDPLVHNIKGSGLGLSLVRHIARAHGGDVHVESVPDKGSKFTIKLPLDGAPRTGAVPA
jgi:signal transduction histidine kinase